MNPRILLSCIFTLFLGWSSCTAFAASPSLLITRIIDKRIFDAPGYPSPRFSGTPIGLILRLHVSGKIGASAAYCGPLVLQKAVDNRGHTLKVLSTNLGGLSFSAHNQRLHRIDRSASPLHGFDITIHLTEPTRTASQISILQGSFQVLASGKPTVVKIHPYRLLGQTLHSPVLKEAGLRVNLLTKRPFGAIFAPKKGVFLSISGNAHSLWKVKVFNAKHKSIASGSSIIESHHGINDVLAYGTRRILRPTDTVELIVMVGQKEISVPVKFRNIKLP